MNLTPTGITNMIAEGNTELSFDEARTFSGINAGICYGSHGYWGTDVTNPDKAYNRFNKVASTGHHSIAGHVEVTVLLEDIPKAVAMVLNSLSEYNTSEKSGRYTKMTGASEKEQKKYNKWVAIFADKIKELYTDLDDKAVSKLAMENARYLLSIFTPTTMSYTTSIRQWNYILDWCKRFESLPMRKNNYNTKMKAALKELGDLIETKLFVRELRDFKRRQFDFLACQVKSTWSSPDIEEYFHETYLTTYESSFVALAQAQRHRNLDYYMVFSGKSERFYIPEIIREDESLSEEWIKDLTSLKSVVPQATLVKVYETGTVENFLLKCSERLCGRAQLEVMKQTKDTLIKIDKLGKYNDMLAKKLENYIKDDKIKTKCQILHSCKESCIHGPNGALGRVI